MKSTALWSDQSERGSAFLMKVITRMSLLLGRPCGRALLYPICLYFLINGGGGTTASRKYLRRVLGREASTTDVFNHYFFFASTILDRVFLLARKYDSLSIEIVGKPETDRMATPGTPCLYIGAHFGSFEVMRVLSTDKGGHKINVLMNEENARKMADVLHKLSPEESDRIIPIGSIDSLLMAKNCIDRGERLALLGDRLGSDTRTVPVTFFGEQVLFPAGPMSLAMILRIPVALFFGVYLGGNKYQIYLEPFIQPAQYENLDRKSFVQQHVERYAGRLEYFCRLAPFNWFNFFDFWSQGRHAGPAVAKTPED